MTRRIQSTESIGIDSTDGALRIVGMGHDGVVFAESCATVPQALAARLANGTRCSAAAAPASCLLFTLQPPDLPESKLVRILPSLLDVQLPLPLSECLHAFTREGKVCHAHAIRRSDLAHQLDTLRQAGCDPARIVPPVATAWSQALVEYPPQADDEPRALFLCGSAQTLLATGHGRALERQTVFKTDAAEFSKRLRLSFSGIPGNLVCIIAGAGHALASQALRDATNDSTTRLETVRSPEFLLARALAADAARVGRWDDANLRTDAFVHPSATRRKSRPIYRLAAALGVCSVLLFPLAGLILARAKTEALAAERAFDRAIDALAGYDVKTKGERAVQDARAGLAAQFDAEIGDYRNSIVPSRLARLAERAEQVGVTLHHLTLDGRTLSASGTAASVDKAEEFIRLLGDAGFRAVMSEAPKTDSDGTVPFFLHTPQP